MTDTSAQTAIAWLAVTLAVYGIVGWLQRVTRVALLNPLLISMLVIGGLLAALGVKHEVYLRHVAILHYLLGTAVVALAVPLYLNFSRLRASLWAPLAALTVASAASVMLTLIVVSQLDASPTTQLSLLPKHATTAVSTEIARTIGGLPPLAAFVTVVTSLVTAVAGPRLLDLLRIRSACARGLAYGMAGHAVGTSRAFAESEITGCWSSVAMTVNAVLTAILVPLALRLWQATAITP